MKAAVFHAARDIRIEDVPAPTEVGPREVLVRPTWCGICGTDLHEYAMGPIVTPAAPHPLNGAVLPQILGHEFSAEVLEVGRAVTRVKRGDRVCAMPLLVDHECYYCRRGLDHLCVKMACVGLSYAWGGIAELAVLPEGILTVLPEAVSELQGALVEPAAVAAYGVDAGHVKPGDSVLITGAGPIGALAALYAASLGARVFVSELNPTRRALIRSLGVAEVLDPSTTDVAAYLVDRHDGVGVDAAIECAGAERALQTALASVRSAGRVVQTGLHTRPAAIDAMLLAQRDLTLVGTWCYPVTDFPRIAGLIASGRLPVEKIVTAKIAIEDLVANGFEPLLSPTGGQVKVLVNARG
ncbi:MAG TPA: alcohol dehydrogenase catalytic domain-containing protein [Kofleriaceae bacterium]|nr:alcohol dehydrogenase catalytic domain-containing protein [Kofleriaceae bacterium]